MAVAEVSKVFVFFHSSLKDEVVERLQEAGVVDVEGFDEERKEREMIVNDRVQAIESDLRRVEKAIGVLERGVKRGFLFALLNAKTLLSKDKFERFVSDEGAWREVLRKVEEVEEKLQTVEQRRNELRNTINMLKPWSKIGNLDSLKSTKKVVILPGSVPEDAYQSLVESIVETAEEVFVEDVVSVSGNKLCIVCYHRDVESSISPVLKKFGFQELPLVNFSGTVEENVSELQKELDKVNEEEETLISSLSDMYAELPRMEAVYDFLLSELNKEKVKMKLFSTSKTGAVRGWVKDSDKDKVLKSLDGLKEVFVEFEKAERSEDMPVALENKGIVKSFEFIVKLFGVPKVFEIDPTPIVMPFFTLFFAICLTDAGYGLVLLILSLLILRKFGMSPDGRDLFKVLAVSGTMTVIVGILTGGIFGIDFNLLPPTLKSIVIFNPLEQPLILFGVALGLGVIHVSVGYVADVVTKARNGKLLDGILDDVPWIVILLGSSLLVANSILIKSELVEKVADYSILGGMGAVLVFGGRHSKSILGKVFGGLPKIYGITGLLGDVLSYARLLALGLATSVIAMVVNTLAGMVWDGVFIIFGVLILIVGHLFNMVVNALGAFVHTIRLHFVELFGKFYEGGGREFKPFSKVSKRVVVEESQ